MVEIEKRISFCDNIFKKGQVLLMHSVTNLILIIKVPVFFLTFKNCKGTSGKILC